jgi:hypothetical protein
LRRAGLGATRHHLYEDIIGLPKYTILEFTLHNPEADEGAGDRQAKARAELKRWRPETTRPITPSAEACRNARFRQL